MSYEDLTELAERSGLPVGAWMDRLARAGLQQVLLTPRELANPEVTAAVAAAGLDTAQVGGLPQGGDYFFAARYDTMYQKHATPGIVTTRIEYLSQERLYAALEETGSNLILVENVMEIGSVLPANYTMEGYHGSAGKCFWLAWPYRYHYNAPGYLGVEDNVNMFFRAVVDRGMTVLWLSPMLDPDGVTVTDPEEYAALLDGLAQRINRVGYRYGPAQGIPSYEPSWILIFLCGLAVLAAALLLLRFLFPKLPQKLLRLLALLALGENALGLLLLWDLQISALALLASILFPCCAAVVFVRRLSGCDTERRISFPRLLSCLLPALCLSLWGAVLISALASSSGYLLVLKLFRGVKFSQAAVYLFSICYLAVFLLHQKGAGLKEDLRRLTGGDKGRRNRRTLWLVLASVVVIGLVYLLRTGDGMLAISNLELQARNWLEYALIYRPRTKEFLIAWPASVLACLFWRYRQPLLCWLFCLLTSIGFASVTNTFCHSRSHFFTSLARTALGLTLGLILTFLLHLLLSLLPDPGRKGRAPAETG